MAKDEASSIPLCIDLDGTLIRSDLLIESALALLKTNPLFLFLFPLWLLRGRANLKREIARRVQLDAVTLPYDARVLTLLRAQNLRPRVLCTASDHLLADAVAQHLGLFDEVIASDGTRNLSGDIKAAMLVQRYGERGFDYAGNETKDLAIWKWARLAFVVNGDRRLDSRVKKQCDVAQVMPRERPGLHAWLGALRPHQWLKNTLVFVPPLAAHLVMQPAVVARSLAAFAIFSICASGVYLLNDLFDLASDRRHPRKRKRPFASGQLPLTTGMVTTLLFTFVAFAAAFALAPRFVLVLLGYFLLTLAYSLYLKQIAMLDVIVLAALYTTRIIAGAVVIGIGLSFWLLAFSMFLFLSLAILKRYTELGVQRAAGNAHAHGRGYATSDYELLAALGGASGYLSVLVLALYINSTASELLYRHPQVLWLLCPLLLYWVSRAWIVAHRGTMHDDPIVFAVTDRVSLTVLVLGAVVALVAIR